MKAQIHFTPVILLFLFSQTIFGQSTGTSDKLNDVVFHTEDIENFWRAFDETYPSWMLQCFNPGTLT